MNIFKLKIWGNSYKTVLNRIILADKRTRKKLFFLQLNWSSLNWRLSFAKGSYNVGVSYFSVISMA